MPFGLYDHYLLRDDRLFAVQPKRLLRRQEPFAAETLVAVARAEFPERRIPWRAVAWPRARAGRNQPALHHFLQETVRHETLAVNPAQLARLEHTPVPLPEAPSASSRDSASFSFGVAIGFFLYLSGNKFIMSYLHKYIA